MARRKKSEVQKAYEKEFNRLKRAVQRAEKQGYIFRQDPLPKTPKTITKKSVQRLQKKKTPSIYDKALWLDRDTGEILTAKVHKQDVKKQSIEKAKKTRQLKAEIQIPKTRRVQTSDIKPTSPRSKKVKPLQSQEQEPLQPQEQEPLQPQEQEPLQSQHTKEVQGKQTYYPTFDIVEIVRQAVSDLPTTINVYSHSSGRKLDVPFDSEKNQLTAIIDKQVAEYGEDYNNYLLEHEDFIMDLIDTIRQILYEDEINLHFVQLARELNMGYPLTHDESERIADLTDI